MTTTSTTHLGGVIAATQGAVTADRANARVAFQASATAHDAVASTVSSAGYQGRGRGTAAAGARGRGPEPGRVLPGLAALLSDRDLALLGQKLGIAVDEITAHAEGDLDVQGFFGFTRRSAPDSRRFGW